MNAILKELYNIEILKAIPLPNMGENVVSCPHCKCIQICNSKRDEKCSGCGQIYQR